jgi:hypothetical protein
MYNKSENSPFQPEIRTECFLNWNGIVTAHTRTEFWTHAILDAVTPIRTAVETPTSLS